MVLHKYYFLIVLCICTLNIFGAQKNSTPLKKCTDKKNCLSNPECACWCSEICEYRAKNDTDNPVWVENDPNGKYCYCKQRDLDRYEAQCVTAKKVAKKTKKLTP